MGTSSKNMDDSYLARDHLVEEIVATISSSSEGTKCFVQYMAPRKGSNGARLLLGVPAK